MNKLRSCFRSLFCFWRQIILKENLKITDDLKEICNQFKSGGTAKEGRGILDEYYTDSKDCRCRPNLIKDHFKNRKKFRFWNPALEQVIFCML
jgi:hypothetical protein